MHINESLKKEIIKNVEEKGGASFFSVAQALKIPEQLVAEYIGEDLAVRVSVHHFKEIMVLVANWGNVTVAMQNNVSAVINEGMLPLGKFEEGIYQFVAGHPYTISGSINVDQLSGIYFVQREVGGVPHKSIFFYDHSGVNVFSVSLPLNDQQVFVNHQMESYRSLLSRISGKAICSCCA